MFEATSLLGALACPTCRGSWRVEPSPCSGSFLLGCDRCRIRVPVIDGMPLFSECEVDDGRSPEEVLDRVRGPLKAADSSAFREEKRRRGVVDAYAAWQPFNESGRTPLSFVPLLRELLRPGDLILDLANRSGWTGEFLAGLFPEQRVLSVWEGNTGTLGYRGFLEWLPRESRAPNLEILFFDPNAPWPLAEGSIRFMHAYDVLHHGRLEVMLPEAVRASTPDGVLLFPHVHLSNPGNEPGFHRPGQLRDAEKYRRVFGGVLRGRNRRACVMGEASFFAAQKSGESRVLADEPESKDYNGLIAVVPSSWTGRPLALPESPREPRSTAVITNPLFDVSLTHGAVTVSSSEGMSEIPDRHPVYARLIPAAVEGPLDGLSRAVLYWADRVATIETIAARTGETPESLGPVIDALERRELARAVRVSRAGYRLQRFHDALDDSPPADEDDLPKVWRRALERHGDRVFLVDDGDDQPLTYRDADRVIIAMARRLRAAGVGPGDRLALCAPLHIEGIMLFWAAAHVGAALAMIDASLPPFTIAERLGRMKPKLLFASEGVHRSIPGQVSCAVVLLDPSESSSPPAVSTWLRDEDYAEGPFEAVTGMAQSPACILMTSGSTGSSRGVVLSQQALAHSGRLMARLFDWQPCDVHICLADLHSMSGLRNPAIATVHAGASTVIAAQEVRANPALLGSCTARRRVTLLTATPALLRQLSLWSDKIAPGALASLRRVMCTGSALTAGVRAEFQRLFSVPVTNYYGLTETGGLCVSESPETEADGSTSGDIGRPVDALLRVVDDTGSDAPQGSVGELLIRSANLFLGYLDDPAATRAAFLGAWFRTGDRARLGPDGSCHLLGRKGDAIKNIYAEFVSVREVEEALATLSGLADAAVTSFVDRTGQEHLAALVVPGTKLSGPAQEGNWLSDVRLRLENVLGARRMPAKIVVSDGIPRTSNGKLDPVASLEWILTHE